MLLSAPMLGNEILLIVAKCEGQDREPKYDLDELLRTIFLQAAPDIHACQPADAEQEPQRPVRRGRLHGSR